MKTLLLASSGSFITEHEIKELAKPIKEMKMAYIITASKGVDDLNYIKNHMAEMDELGFDYEEIDIEGKTETELRDILKNKEMVYVEGGNSFYLLKCVRASGFDKVIKDLISDGVIYAGASAGSYLACPTIEVASWKHQNRFDHYGVKDFKALNLVPFLVTVHYNDKDKELIQAKIKNSKYPVKILNDEQAILVQDDKIKLLGEGKEIKLI